VGKAMPRSPLPSFLSHKRGLSVEREGTEVNKRVVAWGEKAKVNQTKL